MKTDKTNQPKCPRCGSRHLAVDRSGEFSTWKTKCLDCRKEFPYNGPTYFNGELMTCALCGKQEQHVVGVETNWRVIIPNERVFYVCVDHFPPDGSGQLAFQRAYQTILSNLMNRQD